MINMTTGMMCWCVYSARYGTADRHNDVTREEFASPETDISFNSEALHTMRHRR